MKRALFVPLLLALAAPLVATAHTSVGFGVGVGLPVYGPSYPYPYAPAYLVEPAPVVVQQEAPPGPASQASESWYYCPARQAYYPYVHECASGWQAVPSRPSRPSR